MATSPAAESNDSKTPKYVVHADQDYDFVRERHHVHKPTNLLESVGHLIKGCLGGGILGIHEAYMKAGLWTAVVFTVIFGVYVTYCMQMLISAAQTLYKRLHLTEMSYPDLAEASLETGPFPKYRKYSKAFRYIVDFTICFDLFGACCVYQIIIAKTVKQLVDYAENQTEDEGASIRLYLLFLLVPILMLCMITSLKYLAPFTLLADVFIVITVCSTVVYSLDVAPAISERPGWKTTEGFIEFIGIVVFSMEGIGVSLPIENHMKNPMNFSKVLGIGMSVVVVFVFAVGFFGYWAYGEDCKSPVTLNFPMHMYPMILKGLMGFMIFVTFALNFWPPFNLVWVYLRNRHDPEKHWLWERVYRAGTVTLITLTSIAFPNIGNLMGLLGSFCLSNMGFIYPAIIEILVVYDDPGFGTLRWRLWKNIFVIILGFFICIAGTYVNVKGLFLSM